jgi:Xaa-Pro aminopeptidase
MRINEFAPDVGFIKSLVGENVARLNSLMATRDIDAVFVITVDNWRYLTGLPVHHSLAYSTVNAALLAAGAELPVLLPLDFFASRIRVIAPWYRIAAELPFYGTLEPLQPTGVRKWSGIISDVLKHLGLEQACVAFDAGTPWVLQEHIKRELNRVRVIDACDLLSEARLLKNKYELQSIRHACSIADHAIEAALSFAKDGVAESEVAGVVEHVFQVEGAEYATMAPAVFSGDHPLLGYLCSSDRKLRTGELVRLDIACTVDGYCCCIARTGFIGAPDDEILNLYNLLRQALKAGIDAVSPGATNTQVHETMHTKLQRGSSNKYGLGWYGGHGIGLGLHEQPLVGRSQYVDEVVLKPGMTFALEPAIFIPERGWLGLEDNVVVTESGAEVLSKASFEAAAGVNSASIARV